MKIVSMDINFDIPGSIFNYRGLLSFYVNLNVIKENRKYHEKLI